VTARPPVGLFSELEALRYVEVGSRFKTPLAPLWVVASQTHYSLLKAALPHHPAPILPYPACCFWSKTPLAPLWVVASQTHYSLL
jgi:hypothetical protein